MTNVLVVGGAGYIGSAVTAHLVEGRARGDRVRRSQSRASRRGPDLD